MNNYYLFFIRPDYVTQLLAHLLAGIVVLALIVAVKAPERSSLPDPMHRPAQVTELLPADATMLAASDSGPR